MFGVSVTILLIVQVIGGAAASKLGNCTKYGSYGTDKTNHLLDTNMGVGDPISIHCTLDQFNNYSAEQLRWIVNGTAVAPPLVTVIGDKTLSLNLDQFSLRGTGSYRCNVITQKGLKGVGLCIAKVNVGQPPLKVNNFSCLSHNWEYMDCTWSVPYNPIKTEYTLIHVIHDKAVSLPCSITTRFHGVRGCNLTKASHPMYDMYKKNFTFYMNGSNVLGKQTWEFFFNHLSRVKPKAPSKLSSLNVARRSAVVKWSPPEGIPKDFAYNLLYKVRYRSNYDTMDRTLLENRTTLQLSGLIPHAHYEVSISCITVAADQKDDILWSPVSETNFTTLPDVPAVPPEVTNGSFHLSCLLDRCSAAVYWKAISRKEWQGDNFTYDVVAEPLDGEPGTFLLATEVTSGSALIENLMTSKSYKFILRSKNEMGMSNEQSELILNPYKLLKRPSSIVVTGYSETLYEVSWTPPPVDVAAVTGYKVFAISSHTPFIKSPEGSILWETVDRDTLHSNVSVTGRGPFYSFGVVALGDDGRYSDIEWNTCIVYFNGTIGKMKKVDIDSLSSTTIAVKWSIDCAEKKGIVTGYNIHYCHTKQENSTECIGHARNHTVIGARIDKYVIPNLKPDSCYQVSVSAVTKAGYGEFSDPKFTCTNEAAPTDPPRDVKVSEVTNSSFVVSWKPPTVPNGCITKFHIRYVSSSCGETLQVVNVSACGIFDLRSGGIYAVNVTDQVRPYINYSVTVEACTGITDCSPKSEPVAALTDIGVPEQMAPPLLRTRNDTHLLVESNMLRAVNGPELIWDLQVVEKMEGNRTETRSTLRGIRNNMTYIRIPCEESGDGKPSANRTQVRTRAVNYPTGDGLPLEGAWSEYAEYRCPSPEYSIVQIVGYIVLAVVIMTIICVVVIYVFKEGKSYWIKITTIKVVLPQGIEAENNEKFENGLRQFDSGLRQQKKDNTYSRLDLICDSVPTAKLLNDDARFRNISGDTTRSNCSTDGLLPGRNWANDSVASGTQDSNSSRPSTATTNVSTDSSMELASSIPESPDSVFAEHPLKNAVAPATTTTAANATASAGASTQPPTSAAAAAALFSPSLGPIGESPQHYSKFAGYYKGNLPGGEDTNDHQPEGTSSGYVAAPYSKFALGHAGGDENADTWRHSAAGNFDGRGHNRSTTDYDNNSPIAASYSKFGSGSDALFPGPLTFDKVDSTSPTHHHAPATSTPTRLSPGYSVFGMAGEPPNGDDDDDDGGTTKGRAGYVLATAFNGVAASAPVVSIPTTSLEVADEEANKRVGRLSPTVYDDEDLGSVTVDPTGSHKRSPSNASSTLPAGYCRMALSRPTSVGSDAGHYVAADPAASPDFGHGSPSKGSEAGGGSGAGGLRSPSAELPAITVYQNVFGDAVADDAAMTTSSVDVGESSAGYATVQQMCNLSDGNS